MNGSGRMGAHLWRSLLSVALAYAVAIQSLMLTLGGFSLPANAGQDGPAIELCLHDASGAPALPADQPDLSGCTHCIFCFAGAHQVVVGGAPASFQRVDVAMVVVPWRDNTSALVRLTRHTIASPRGPPLSA